jgi:hypothetical protein
MCVPILSSSASQGQQMQCHVDSAPFVRLFCLEGAHILCVQPCGLVGNKQWVFIILNIPNLELALPRWSSSSERYLRYFRDVISGTATQYRDCGVVHNCKAETI